MIKYKLIICFKKNVFLSEEKAKEKTFSLKDPV